MNQCQNCTNEAGQTGLCYVCRGELSLDQITTPSRYAGNKRHLRAMRVEARAELARIRDLRASPRFLDSEEAEGDAVYFSAFTWPRYRAMQKWLREMVPVKNSHISPRAAARAEARTGCAR